MENPASWGRAERVIHEALREADAAREAGVFGASRAMVVASALRREGLLVEADLAPQSPAVQDVVADEVVTAEARESVSV